MDRRAALAVGRAWCGLLAAQGALPAGVMSLGCRAEGSRFHRPSYGARAERRSQHHVCNIPGTRSGASFLPQALTLAGGTGAGCSADGWAWASSCGHTGAAVPCGGLVGADSHI